MDGAIVIIDVFLEVVVVVGNKVDVLMDGGICRGIDIFKVLVLGVKVVLIGCLVLWVLVVNGEIGVYYLLELLCNELDVVMVLSGCVKVENINFSLVC